MDARATKTRIHDVLQSSAGVAPSLEGAVLAKWHVAAEFALPDGSQALVKMSGSPDGADLRSWEAAGLLSVCLAELLGDCIPRRPRP